MGQDANGVGFWQGKAYQSASILASGFPTFTPGSLYTVQIDMDTGTIGLRKDNGSFVTHTGLNFFNSSASERLYPALGQDGNFVGEVTIYSSEAEMSANGLPITDGYKAIKSAGVQ